MNRRAADVIFTIGHSTRTVADFVALLRQVDATLLVDVRSIPRSRTTPQFNGDTLPDSLAAAGIGYRHLPALGGLRKPRRDSTNTAWRNEGFRGYADYMQSKAFSAAIDDLMQWAAAAPTAVMCAEAVWWRCHRQLIADALVARGVTVRHIQTPTSAPEHKLTEFARVEGVEVVYPGLVDL
jgi:uncharacterized protein (DUF488 family)